MAHGGAANREYRLLQRRLDRNVTGAPESPTFMKILQLLFSPEEARLAARIPSRPVALDALSHRLGIPEDELSDKVTEMARRGFHYDRTAVAHALVDLMKEGVLTREGKPRRYRYAQKRPPRSQ